MLTPLKELAIVALVSSPTKKAAAKATGISYRTILNWVKQPEFKSKYEAALSEVVQSNMNVAICKQREKLDAYRSKV